MQELVTGAGSGISRRALELHAVMVACSKSSVALLAAAETGAGEVSFFDVAALKKALA